MKFITLVTMEGNEVMINVNRINTIEHTGNYITISVGEVFVGVEYSEEMWKRLSYVMV